MTDISKLAATVIALEHQKIVSYMDVATSALLVHDVILNFELEMRLIWREQWSIVTVLYLVQRYLPFFDTIGVLLYRHFAEDLSPQDCDIANRIIAWCFINGLVLSEVLLTLRIWAMWKKSIPVGVGLFVFSLVTWAPCFVVVQRFLDATQFDRLPLPRFRQCFVSGGSHILYVCWVLLIIYDTAMLTMILIPGIPLFRMGGRSKFMRAIYRDGAIYYGLVFLVSLINVVVTIVLPADLVHLFTAFERVMHSILTSRVVLHIRQLALQPGVDSHHLQETDVTLETMFPSYRSA